MLSSELGLPFIIVKFEIQMERKAPTNDFSYMEDFKNPRTHARKAHELKSHFIKVFRASKQVEGEKGSAAAGAVKSQMISPHLDS